MSDGTQTREGLWPDPADAAEAPTVAGELQGDAPTAEYPTVAGTDAPPAFAASGSEDGEEDEWPVRAPKKGVRLGIPAALLLGVTLVALGFWGGAIAQKNHATASGPAGAGAFAARLRNAAANGGNGANGANGANGGGLQFPGAGNGTDESNSTTGTISVVDGKILYILTASNQLVKVTLNSSTTVTRNAKAVAAQLRPGDTVVVQGATGKGGDVEASSVAATAQGVSSTTGGFGGGGFGGGGGGFTPGAGAAQGTPGG